MDVLDNKTSKDLLNSFTKDNIEYQLVVPYKHHSNQAERVIQTFKSHFKACLVGVYPKFLLLEWDRFIPQDNIRLNLLYNSRCSLKFLVYSYKK